jgi:hypothetical protein
MKTSAALRGIYLPVLGLALLLGQLAFAADARRDRWRRLRRCRSRKPASSSTARWLTRGSRK